MPMLPLPCALWPISSNPALLIASWRFRAVPLPGFRARRAGDTNWPHGCPAAYSSNPAVATQPPIALAPRAALGMALAQVGYQERRLHA